MTKHLRCYSWIFGASLLFASQALAGNAKNGQGNMTVSPNVVSAGSTNNFTFTFLAPNSGNYNPGSQATFLIPANWVVPQTNNSASAGFVSVAPILSKSVVSMGSITGSGPWTITINFSTAQKGGGFTLSYRNVVAPTNTGVSTFSTKTKQAGGGGRLTSLKAGSPTITVNSTNKSTTAITVVSSLNPSIYGQTVTFTATVSSTNAAAMSGTVTFMDGDVILGTSPVNGTRQATISTNGFSVDDSPHSIIAQYNGSTNFNGSISSELSQDVTEATLTVSGLVANSKTYDGNTNALLDAASAALVGVVSGDDVALDVSSAAATFANKNVGTNKPVSITGLALSGADALNYILTQPSATADIAPRNLTIAAIGVNKGYDGTANATVSLSDDRVAGDALLTTYTNAAFSDRNAGAGKTVTVSGVAISGADAGNYTFNTSTTTSADITTATVTASVTINNKPYDGTTTATIATRTLSGVLGSDAVNAIGGTADFASQNVGVGKAVTAAGLNLSGADAGNYVLSSTTATNVANITAAVLTVTANDTNRVFGASNPKFAASFSGFAAGETVAVVGGFPAFSTSANSASPVGGNPYLIVVTNGTLNASNYTFVFVDGRLTIDAANSTTVLSFSANPSATDSNVTLTATVTAAAPGAGTPSGTVQFFANNLPLGAAVGVTGGIATLDIATLPHGSNTISAVYLGDGNFLTSSNSANILINSSPIAQSASLSVTENTSGSLSVSTLLSGCSDPDGDSLSLSSVSPASAQGGTVSVSGGTITYTPPGGYVGSDSFTYTIADSFGATPAGPGTVTITVQAPPVQTPATLSLVKLAGGSIKVSGTGTINATYLLQASTNLMNWTILSTNVADVSGAFSFTDSNASQFKCRFYRASKP